MLNDAAGLVGPGHHGRHILDDTYPPPASLDLNDVDRRPCQPRLLCLLQNKEGGAAQPSDQNLIGFRRNRRECVTAAVDKRDGAIALRGLGRIAADGIQQDIGIEEAQHHPRRSCASSRDNRSPAKKSRICARNSRSWRSRPRSALSSETSSTRKRLTSAESEVSCSAALVRARR